MQFIMIILKKFGSRLLVCIEDCIIVYNDYEAISSKKELKIPEAEVGNQHTKSLEEILKPENKIIISVCVSADSEFAAVTLQNRQLIIYDNNLNVICNTLSKRTASRATFTKSNDVLIADKTGDVYLYNLKDTSEPTLLLGHLSMLLDITVSDCGKYIITCDRDEKIRVSCYPNCYNIVSYCLGHKEFVSHVAVIQDLLISVSGDGRICGWDYINGKKLFVVNTNDYIEDEIIERFCKDMNAEKMTVNAVPITDMQIFENIIAVTVLGYCGIQLYYLNQNEGHVNFKLMQNIATDSELLTFALNTDLLLLTKTLFKRFKFNKNEYVEIDSKSLNEVVSYQGSNINSKITSLYKRKFDNVQEYLDRKKVRLENKM